MMLQMRLMRRWRGVFDRVVTCSDAMRRSLIAEGIEPVEVIHNGVPVSPPRPPLGSVPKVAFAGRLVPEKGVDELLQAFARVVAHLGQARLVIVGHGPQKSRLEQRITDLRLDEQVIFRGQMSRAAVESLFADAWLQAVPSIWPEPFGLVAAEAMMRGTAVVASACGGLVELVQDGQTGLLVPPGDVGALAEALRRVLSDRSLAERMGSAGRKVAGQRYTESIQVQKFLDLYETMC